MHETILQGMMAASLLDERRAEAAHARLSAQVAAGAGRDLRGAAGRLLTRLGSRLAGAPVVSRTPSHAA